MRLGHEELNGRGGHEAGLLLLERLYRAETGEDLPQILRTAQGKPYFPENPWHFSISHTKNHVFCALSRQNVGIDAENMDRPVSEKLAEKVLSPKELEKLRACPNKNAAFLQLWVLKEAYAKLTGRGLGDYLFRTDFDPSDPRIQIISGCYVAVLTEDAHAF